ncbi:MAG: phospholipase A [Thermoanaerobaculales bacterium]|nr:phospholipase A [Thermoanaerobaculales bacterium]
MKTTASVIVLMVLLGVPLHGRADEPEIDMEAFDFVFSVKPWIIAGSLEDNPDIRDFMGNAELRGAYKWQRHTISLMLRNHLESGFSKGAFQVDWSFPIHRRLRGYTQYFNGYGESLIDYNVHSNTIGVGISFTDYF